LSSDIEKQLEDYYMSVFQTDGISSSEAQNAVRDLLRLAKEECQKDGISNLPQNFGNILLERESTDEKIKSMLAKRRKEGVRDEDIRWWWNMHELEKKMMLKFDDVNKFSLYRRLRDEEGLNEEEAMKEVRKFHVIYGDPDDTTHTVGDDRPLPEELKDRINIYIIKKSTTDRENYKKEIEGSSTLNALLRKEIKKGNI
jgi:hypothetical protein